MNYAEEYRKFLLWIINPANGGIAGPIIPTRKESAYAKLFAAYLNCKYPPNNCITQKKESEITN